MPLLVCPVLLFAIPVLLGLFGLIVYILVKHRDVPEDEFTPWP